MKNPFQPGDQKIYRITVGEDRLARFDAGLVHPVYATFAIAKDAEWACRLFVLDMLEEGEEGIGGSVTVYHRSPALLGAQVEIVAQCVAVENNRIDCQYKALCNNRLIAEGEQTQYILDKARFQRSLEKWKNETATV